MVIIIVRKATIKDVPFVEDIYNEIICEEEAGNTNVGWKRNIYPIRKTAEDAVLRGDLFVGEHEGKVVATAIINKLQMESYIDGNWEFPAENEKVMVLHTLCISPKMSGRGFGKEFVGFYEKYSRDSGCPYLRMDTNEKNARARKMYKNLGYKEVGIVPCIFNGIEGVNLILLEKYLD